MSEDHSERRGSGGRSAPGEKMTQARDPMGKRALFSGPRPVPAAPERPERKSGGFDVVVHCASCDQRTTLSAAEFVLQHFPLWAWLPWRKHSRLMRCPACGRFAWHSVSRASNS